MLGIYENFPKNVHRTAYFTTSLSPRKLQSKIGEVLSEINGKTMASEDFVKLRLNCTIVLEVGIAEGNAFNYFDEEEKSRILEIIKATPFQIMDFFFSFRYYQIRGGKKTPLKFDYYITRLTFNKNILGIHVFHERGPRYTSPEDLTEFLVKKISTLFPKKLLKPLSS